jgi:hypothetical protein
MMEQIFKAGIIDSPKLESSPRRGGDVYPSAYIEDVFFI